LQEYVDYAKKNPGKTNIGVAALGGGGHLGAVLVEQVTGTSLNIVPYKGTGELLPDMLGGSLDSSSDFPAAYVPHAKAGTVRILAVISDQRVPAFPDVPTSAEGGYPKLVIGGWFGLFGPKGLPRAIVDKLNAAANTELKDPQVRARIESLGYQVIGGTPEQFVKQVDTDFVTISDLVKLGHITLQ
jgi:tripartite-type tricarboxylate transporter receptor subunit TctC